MPTDRTSQSEANRNKEKLDQSFTIDKRSNEFGKDKGNFDPSHQNEGIDAGKPSNPNTPTPRNMDQKNVPLHPAIGDDDRLKASGKAAHGLPNAPVVSINPTSGKTVDKQEPEKISDAFDYLGDGAEPAYSDIEAGEGLLVVVEPNKTLDQTVLEAHKAVNALNAYWSVPELNEEGEEISDQVIVHEFKRNEDKTIQLGDKSKPITGANHTIRKRVIQLRQYVAKPVMADDDKISSDGVLIVRVF